MKKQPQITEQTRKNIADAFWVIYKEKDISQITVTEIIKRAGYNRATFYNYFKSIESVLEYIEDKVMVAFMQSLEHKSPYSEFNQIFINDLHRLYESYGEYLSVLIGENGDPHFCARFSRSIKPIFYRSLGDDPPDDFKIDIMFEYITYGMLGSFHFWSKNRDKLSAPDFLKFTDYVMNNGTKGIMDKYFNCHDKA